MSALFVPYLAAAVLLVVAGVPKALDPAPTARVARDAGIPAGMAAIRVFGFAEIATGLAVVVLGGRIPGLLLAGAYAAFAIVVARGIIRGDMETCGCFSGDDAPPSVLHVVVDLGLAAAALVVALSSSAPASWARIASDRPAGALAATALALVVAALVHLVLARLPRAPGITLPAAGARP